MHAASELAFRPPALRWLARFATRWPGAVGLGSPLLGGLLFGAALGLPALSMAQPQPQPADAGLPALRDRIAQTLQASGVPGAAVVLIEHGRVVLEHHHGTADLATQRPVTALTVFRAGSISKTFTAMAALALAEDGRLPLQAPLAELLPQWLHDNPWAATSPVRLEHLLEHTAGLDDVRYRHYLIDSATMPLEDALLAFGPYAVRWRPGSGTAYSNAGPLVAGRAIERAAGTDFASFVSARLTGPLGMHSARWTRSDDVAPRLARSYAADGRTLEAFVETPARPSGSLNITARDLAQLPRLLLGRGMVDGVRVLRPESVTRMETPSSRASTLPANLALGWGLGLQADADGRTVFYGHDGSIDGFVARFAYAPALDAGYVVMANSLSDAPMDVAQQLRRHLERRLPPAVAPSRPLSAEQRRAWAGQYQSVTPRQELLRAVIGLTQWEGAVFDGETLRYAGRRWLHQGDGVFRAEGNAAPGLVFAPTPDGGLHAVTRDGERRRVPRAEAFAKIGSLMLLAALLLLSLLLAPAWAGAAWRGRLPKGAARRARLLPVLTLWATVALPFGVLMLLGSADLAWLGRPTLAGWALAALGWLVPLLWLAAAAALLQAQRGAAVPPRVVWLGALNLLPSALLLAWLAVHGWLGMRIWQ